MDELICPLCNSKNLLNVSEIFTSQITSSYKKVFKLNVNKYFFTDRIITSRCIDCDLKWHHPAIPADSHFYDQIQEFKFYYESKKPEFSYALNKILEIKPSSILEIGCGDGHFLSQIRGAFNVFGSEVSQKSIKKLKNAEISLDVKDNTYDFVLFFQVLEHISNVKEFLEWVISRLERNGHIFISVPNNDSKFFTEVFDFLDYPPHHLTQWSKKALENISVLFNLEIIEYYLEPHQMGHFLTLIKTRRENLFESNRKYKIIKKFISGLGLVFDRILAPYFFDHISYPGHTHGILLRKKD